MMAHLIGGLLLIASSAAEPPKAVIFEIDGSQRFQISPYIYGTNTPDWQGKGYNLTLTRWGGNRITAYNWVNNASNAGADWQHQNDGYLDQSDVPGDPVHKLLVAANENRASVIVTVPIAGYVAADKQGGGDVNKTPDYLHKRFLPSLASKNGPFSFRPDLRDGKVYQDELVNFLEKVMSEKRRDPACRIFYALDNEPDLWALTHPRIHPQKTGYEEIAQLNVEYATAIKRVAPKALVFGPVLAGYHGYTTLQDAPDRNGRDFLDYYLDAMRAAERKAGKRLLDVLDVHWYPEARGANVRVVEDDARPEVAAARVQSPRSLWDPGYKEESWITQWSTKGPIRLLPRLREKIEKHYPGTKLAITEYYYGGGADISGAVAQADVLGIFGREGLFAAALWHVGKTDDRFIYAAFAMFRNYDDGGATFGDLGLAAQTSDAQRTSVYASLDGKGRVVLVAINKTAEDVAVRVSMRRCPPSSRAQVFQVTRTDARPLALRDVAVTKFGSFDYRLPPQSVSTFLVLPAKAGLR